MPRISGQNSLAMLFSAADSICTPQFRTVCLPPLPTILVALAMPPDDTVAEPLAKVVALHVAPEVIATAAPLEIVADTALPPAATVNVPPD